jgi:hypothetical protein
MATFYLSKDASIEIGFSMMLPWQKVYLGFIPALAAKWERMSDIGLWVQDSW